MSVQVPNGVVDIAVEDEAEAVAVAKKYLSYFQGALPEWRAADQRLLRRAIPENRLRVYDVRDVIATLCDEDSVLEIRRAFGPGMVTAFGRIEGKPLGIVANNPMHLAGAIDSRRLGQGGALPAALRRLRHPDPVPVRHARHDGRTGGREDRAGPPLLAAVRDRRQPPRAVRHHRAAQGLWARRPGDGGRLVPCAGIFALSWPTGEFGGMGLEGAVKLGYRKELEAISRSERAPRPVRQDGRGRLRARQGAQHRDLFRGRRGDRSRRLAALDRDRLLEAKPRPAHSHKKRPNIDTW